MLETGTIHFPAPIKLQTRAGSLLLGPTLNLEEQSESC